jgi:hypothetical protein
MTGERAVPQIWKYSPLGGLFFIWILVNSFWCRQLLPLFFVYPPPFVSFDAIVKKISENDNRPVTK